MSTKTYTLDIGQDALTLRHSNTIHTARILSVERDALGEPVRIMCDRRVHDPSMSIEGWQASGAVVTELVRMPDA